MKTPRLCVALSLCACVSFSSLAVAAERATLDAACYDRLAPAGKEADAIHGDTVLRNDRVVAVVAAPVEGREANLTVRNVGGSLIDLTERATPSDQLSCLYPGGGGFRFTNEIDWPADWSADGPADGAATIALAGRAISLDADQKARPLTIRTGYELRDGESFLRLVTTITNTGDEPIEFAMRDGVRVDGDTFKLGHVDELGLWWAHDAYWRQAYGVQIEDQGLIALPKDAPGWGMPRAIAYVPSRDDQGRATLAPGESLTWRRRVFPAADGVAVRAIAHACRGEACAPVRFTVTSDGAPLAGAQVRVTSMPIGGGDGERHALGVGKTDDQGRFPCRVPQGDYTIRVTANGHTPPKIAVSVQEDGNVFDIDLPPSGYVEATITDAAGGPIPAKVQFLGQGDTPSPDFGPTCAVRGVKNLQYTPDGRFRAKLLPGEYRWLASYGPEYDAAEGRLTVSAGETAKITTSLERTVDTTGWISSELHSHSSPSGDNTASQRGRVLNLLAEHLEFCPCTEHQRIDVYDEHLAHFGAQRLMLTCPGMELTGQPLPLNHQNAFPLIHHPREQHGGAPRVHPDPVVQIKRLAGWDEGSEKVVQTNHPDLAQMIGDRDEDGVADGGFEEMFNFQDVVEVHPPELIFEPLGAPGEPDSGVGSGGWEGRGNAIVNWLQMLNLGYRVTGVVNTDAHYNHHGSGWLRNWVKSSTDDPARATVDEMIHAYEHGHVVMSNGPYLNVSARGAEGAEAIPGDDLKSDDGKATLRVVVRCPNWLEVNRVQLFLNGRPSEEHNYTLRTHRDWFAPGAEVFNREIKLELEEDTHVVVACCGEDRQLGVLYGEEFGKTMPVAVANPIFLDTDGDKDGDGMPFESNGDDLGNPLPMLENFKPSHGHGHRNHRH